MPKPRKATDALLTDHKMIRKLMTDMTLENPRFAEIAKTAHRVVAGHAWLEDEIFLPAIEKSPVLARRFTDEIYREHQDIDVLMKLIRETKPSERVLLDGYLIQFKSVMETHFRKEEDALFPMAERILDAEGINKLTEDMLLRSSETRRPLT